MKLKVQRWQPTRSVGIKGRENSPLCHVAYRSTPILHRAEIITSKFTSFDQSPASLHGCDGISGPRLGSRCSQLSEGTSSSASSPCSVLAQPGPFPSAPRARSRASKRRCCWTGSLLKPMCSPISWSKTVGGLVGFRSVQEDQYPILLFLRLALSWCHAHHAVTTFLFGLPLRLQPRLSLSLSLSSRRSRAGAGGREIILACPEVVLSFSNFTCRALLCFSCRWLSL